MTSTESVDSGHPGQDSQSISSKFNARFGIIRASRVYIVEHFVMLVSLGLLLISGIGLFNAIINHFMDDPDGAADLGAIIAFEELALYLAVALFALPAFLVLYTRTRMAEREHPLLLTARNRRRLGYVFLMITSLFIVIFSIGFMYTTVLALIGSNVGGSGESWLQTALKQVFAIKYLSLVTYFVSRMSTGLASKEAN